MTIAGTPPHRNHANRSDITARVVLGAMLLLASLTISAVSPHTSIASGQSGTITGLVFQDFNSNGSRDTTVAVGVAVDTGVAGIVVRAFDSTGAQVGSTTTAADGTYSLSVTGAAITAVRIEFTVPSGVPALEGLVSSFATTTGASGSTAGSAVQFATIGNTGVNHAVNRPGDYCQNNPNLAVSRQCMNTSTAPSLWVTNYNGGPYVTANGYTNLYNYWAATTAGGVSTTGSVHGMAWDRRSGRVLTAAYVRSFVRLYENPSGTPRPAALFSTTPTGTTAAAGTGGTTSFLVDLEQLMAGDQFSNTTAPASGVANAGFTGYIPSNAARNLPLGPDSDINASYDGVYEEVGKAGIGDIDSDDNGNLYVVSLYTRELYRVVMPANGTAPTSMSSVGSIVSGVSCNRGDARPFGVTHWRGDLYMGVVCDGTQDFDIAAPNSNSDERNVTYSIRKYAPSTGTWSTFLGPFPLYSATLGGNFKGSPVMTFPDHSGGINHNSWRWNPWTDQFSLAWRTNGAQAWGPIYPQPMPSDLQFDRDGSVIVSMRDRTGDRQTQYVVGSMYPNGVLRDQTGEINAGDIYRICRTGSGFSSSDYVWEGGAGCAQSFDNFNFNNGGVAREYYRDDYGKSDIYHGDQSAGMLEYVPGFLEVINTAMDPHIGWNGSAWDVSGNTFSSSGLSYYLNSSGDRQTSINSGGGVIFDSRPLTALGLDDGSFGKIVGMGDVEALCNAAPVQIGDRVWIDTDGDGVQDPGESPAAGVTVRLYDSSGSVVATTTTNSNGEYQFSSTTSGLTTGVEYTIRFDNPADYASGGPLAGYGITQDDSTTPIAGDTENGIDSDATVVSGYPRIAVAALLPGENNHSFDAGFVPLVGVGNLAWLDSDSDGVQDAGEPPLAGVTVELLDANSDPARDAFGNLVPAQTTGADGAYFFDGLSPGDYRVKFTPPAGYAATLDGQGISSTGSDVDRQSGVTPVFTVSPTASGDTTSDTSAATTALFSNLTIAAGFVPTVSVGDLVWLDTDADGVQDAGEAGLAGVTLTLTNADGGAVTDVFGNPVTTTVTDSQGNYSFDNLPTGQYTVTVTPPAGYDATVGGRGSSSTDSSTGFATSVQLTTGGARDSSLDFGFVPTPLPPTPTTTVLPTTTTTTTTSTTSSTLSSPALTTPTTSTTTTTTLLPVTPSGGETGGVQPSRELPSMPNTGSELAELLVLAMLLLIAGRGVKSATRTTVV